MERLSKKELDQVYKQISQFADYQKDILRPLVAHIKWLEKQLVIEQEENIRISQIGMNQVRDEAPYKPMVRETKGMPDVPKWDEVKPLGERLRQMLKDGMLGSKEWEMTLKWNKISLDEAFTLAEEPIRQNV